MNRDALMFETSPLFAIILEEPRWRQLAERMAERFFDLLQCLRACPSRGSREGSTPSAAWP